MSRPEYKFDNGVITKDGHIMFLEDAVKDLRYLQSTVAEAERKARVDTAERILNQFAEYSDGTGMLKKCNEIISENSEATIKTREA